MNCLFYRLRSVSQAFLALAAHSVMDRNDPPALGASIFPFLLFHELFQTVFANKSAVFHKARLIPFVVALFKVFYQLAGIIKAFKTVAQPFPHDTILYAAFTAMLRLAHIAVETTSA